MSNRDHAATFIILGVLVVVFGITFTVFVIPSGREAQADEDAATGTADTLLHALGRGDGAEACGLLAKPAATALATQRGKDDCPSAVRDLADSLTAAEREAVAAMKLTDDDTRAEKRGTRHTVRLDAEPFGYTGLLVDRQNGTWRVIRME
ncbi:hypothetical protein CP967_24875 [Streptomyces nitrosporeus]|uniref:DUF4878 domain-containing protein n=1 Tax=Streptomyces nitrosporeus TaxID=28894 RepID=A0A5J6FEE4_9ACTN|nr:hypothetical protein [Streptomyces nitrosporeus]QEU74788.1 hypothetical protein CP967_24875 [Streptomyces nitrosporeus]GGY85788.1 hypothetical protein GCM10010327_15700 [Streptomyces nitrosporeus]